MPGVFDSEILVQITSPWILPNRQLTDYCNASVFGITQICLPDDAFAA